MPRGDRTGPIGQGPFTGRGLGYCTGFDSPGFTKGMGAGMGRGGGYGRGMGYVGGFGRGGGRYGRGWGWSRGFDTPFQTYPPAPSMSREDEIKMLKSEADSLKRSQKEIEKRLNELEKEE
ncbi:MAG TPA: DUF5320 domain-containing protein [Bacteroidales bacterium]|nr:DUF5320 domain-containing protein [Bacteroidales bacterium]HPF02782.1 DUF5320 domain-containing protein [Bacteroidales bacterium]HPJ58902.1 DUF5320 domain-containing protein [Bacteroidales bacterium]HPR12156.1 DUF5320 domain-containing protein [Bacteroidales bacterium]HRW84839.1 DUF5320 domain-containing protein [Bacteroidales bacterium]